MKIKCQRFPCEVCKKFASIQVFYNKNGLIKYARARHYVGQKEGKPQFEYHQQTLQYIETQLRDLPKAELGQVGQGINVDQIKAELGSKGNNMVRSTGFEPVIISLEG
jgi:hypothetical protein